MLVQGDPRRGHEDDHAARTGTATTAEARTAGPFAATTTSTVSRNLAAGMDDDVAQSLDDQDTGTGTTTTALAVKNKVAA